ncbi:right-handed parallel beta-helix repeat-containing protein [Kutzneria kofuensis]|uniref:right-handed parallel beta-helix repeat-containing protein n=1 Tax=Kutzneria kofuensis TaxID=103725 RepID=UPI0031ECFD10
MDASGAGGTKATLLDSDFRNIGRIGASVLEQARVTLRNCSFRDGLGGLSAGGESQLLAYDCRVEHTDGGGVIAAGKAILTAERLTVAQPGLYGLAGQDSAWLDVKDSEFGDTRFIGVTTSGSCGGHLVRCSVTGSRGSSVVHNGLVVLTDLRSELPVTEHTPEPPPEAAQQIVNYFNGPVFNAAVYNPLLVQGDNAVPERIPMADNNPSTAQSVTNNYHGPVVHGEVNNAQLAWNNAVVHQNLGHVEQVAPGFEEVARVVTAVLERLADLGLPAADVRDATQNANEVLAEVARPEPDRGVVRRACLTALKGVLAQLAAGLLTGVNAGAVEVGKDLVRDISHLGF